MFRHTQTTYSRVTSSHTSAAPLEFVRCVPAGIWYPAWAAGTGCTARCTCKVMFVRVCVPDSPDPSLAACPDVGRAVCFDFVFSSQWKGVN